MPQIVTINVNQIQAPTPATLQKSGALISQGGTILSAGESALLTLLQDLTPLLPDTHNLSSNLWASGIVTTTTSAPHGLDIDDYIEITITGVSPTEYNGTYLCHITGASTFTYVLANNPGSATVHGAYTLADVGELNEMATSFFTQGAQQAVYVLELGAQEDDDAIAALDAYITANPNTLYTPGATGFYYSYLVPRSWDARAAYLEMLAKYESPTARIYFFTTTTLASWQVYDAEMKDVLALIEAPKYNKWPANVLTALTRESSASAAVNAAPGTGYVPGDVSVLAGGTSTVPGQVRITDTKVVSATVVAGGTTAHSNGAAQVLCTTGTGTKAILNVTITGGTISAVTSVASAGDYTVNPTDITNEPVTGVSFTITGAVLHLIMGALGAVVSQPGAYTVTPSSPVSEASTSGVGSGATWTMTFVADLVVVGTTTTAHQVSVGDWFQLQGCTPTGYNGWHQALAGTASSTLVFRLLADPGAESVLGTLETSLYASAGVAAGEFTMAAPFWRSLSYAPSSTNKVAPFEYSFLFGVTEFPRRGNNALLATLKTAAINYVLDGSEGGITNKVLWVGATKDGRDFTYWYSVDWVAINSDVNLSNTVINGSNNPVNPLYYSQDGINRLQDAEVATMNSAITVGLANGSVRRSSLNATDFIAALDAGTFDGYIVVNAVPFIDYLRVNPGDYRTGVYNGLSVQHIPNRGFDSITMNLNVTDFVVQ